MECSIQRNKSWSGRRNHGIAIWHGRKERMKETGKNKWRSTQDKQTYVLQINEIKRAMIYRWGSNRHGGGEVKQLHWLWYPLTCCCCCCFFWSLFAFFPSFSSSSSFVFSLNAAVVCLRGVLRLLSQPSAAQKCPQQFNTWPWMLSISYSNRMWDIGIKSWIKNIYTLRYTPTYSLLTYSYIY